MRGTSASRRRWARPGQPGERGAAAVEFALVLIPLSMMLFGIISYGYMLSFRQAMSQGAAEGARAGAVWAAAYDESQNAQRIAAAQEAIADALSSYGVTCAEEPADHVAGCKVAIDSCGTAKCVTVRVSYLYGEHSLTPPLPFVPLPNLEYTAEARVS